MASIFDNCSIKIKLSELPLWFGFPSLHRKKGISTVKGLSPDERSLLRRKSWDWLGKKDITFDIGSILGGEEKTLILTELKNRIDSGGSAARREILTSQKFGAFLDYLQPDEKLYKKGEEKFSLAEFLTSFHFKGIELYLGILFDKTDSPATLEADRNYGFYPSSKEGFQCIKEQLEARGMVCSSIDVKVEAVYGKDIPEKLFRESLPYRICVERTRNWRGKWRD